MPQPKPLPPVELLREYFDYDPGSGLLRWKVRPARSRVSPGDIAGSRRSSGYLQVQLNGSNLLVHRVAWKLHTGEEPPELLDHKDRNRSNNTWGNLRLGNPRTNQGNRKQVGRYLPGTSKKHNRWQAGTPTKYLGMYATEKEAHQAYAQWHLQEFGEFSIYADEPFS